MTSTSSTRWVPLSANEDRKLSVSDAGWNLAGIGDQPSGWTRGNRVSLEQPPTPEDICLRTAATAVDSANDMDAISTLTGEPVNIIQANKMTKDYSGSQSHGIVALVSRHLQKCPECESKLEISFPTGGIASGTRIACTNKVGGCTYVAAVPPGQANVPMGDGRINTGRNTDYAFNICFVLSFLQSGDGGTEAARVLGLCGLPNSTTMQSRTFGTIESTLYPVIEGITENILYCNLKAKVALVLGDRGDADGNKLYDLWIEKKLD